MSDTTYVTQPFLPPLEELQPYLEQIWANRHLTNRGPFHEEFERALEVRPDDGPSQTYLGRCREYLESPPPEDWDGVYVMTTK